MKKILAICLMGLMLNGMILNLGISQGQEEILTYEPYEYERLLGAIDIDNKDILIYQNLIKIEDPTTFKIYIVPPESVEEIAATPAKSGGIGSWFTKLCCFCCVMLPHIMPVQPQVKPVVWNWNIEVFDITIVNDTSIDQKLSLFDLNYRAEGANVLIDITDPGDYRVEISLIQSYNGVDTVGVQEFVIISYPQPIGYLLPALLGMGILFFAFLFFRQVRVGRKRKSRVDIT